MPRASTRPEPEPAVSFHFKADRFGFRSTALRNDPAFATNILAALDAWAAAIDALFGDVETALHHCGEARILPTYPSWSTIEQFRTSVRRQLDNKRRAAKTMDASARFAVEELRLYLADLFKWSGAFQIGVWAATIAGLGSSEPDERRRRLQGLRAIPVVHQVDKSAPAEKVLERLKTLRSAPDELIPSALRTVALHPQRLVMNPKYFGAFADTTSEHEPSRIHDWLKRLRNDAKNLDDALAPIRSASLLEQIEKTYWRQWHWLAGSATRDPDIPEITLLDLIHTTRHERIPVVPTHGGRLSIAQWSRILNLARRPGQIVPQDVVDAALNGLQVPIFGHRPPDADIWDDPVVAVIRPRSSQSFAWSWMPQEGVCALALMPSDVVAADRTAEAAPGAGVAKKPKPAEDPIEAELAAMRSSGLAVDILEFIELDGRTTAAEARARAPLRAASEQIFFGSGPAPFRTDFYIEAPEQPRDLVNFARKAYGRLFPEQAPRERPSYVYLLMPGILVWYWLRFFARWIRRAARLANYRTRLRMKRVSQQLRSALLAIQPRR